MQVVPILRVPAGVAATAVMLAVMLVALIFASPSASAHVEMQGAEPPADSVVETAPATVQVLFTGEVLETSTLTVTGPDGVAADAGDGGLDFNSLDRNLLSVNLLPDQPDGVYTVIYTAYPSDGHEPTTGSYTFTVGSATPAMTDATPGATPAATPGATPGSTPEATPIAVSANADVASTTSDGRTLGLIGAALASIVALCVITLFVIRTLSRRVA
ncbi:MAG TPA: copper resistance protein CopC [Thermomicrobiales bacterium]|jgi:methionine-rich copper-binding protein CopC|nr:copper resistance protein CopC [Thermomicrobiales bacterium]